MSLQLGQFGAYLSSPQAVTAELADGLERAGYRALWVGGSPGGGLESIEQAIAATTRLVLATAVVNIWRDDATAIASCWQRIQHRFPDRLLLGIGAGHRELDRRRYVTPYRALVSYLEQLTESGVPAESVLLGALGPRTLRLAGVRTGGAQPFLTTPEHTSQARTIMGEQALLAPVHKAVLSDDPLRARQIGRRSVVQPFLLLDNMVNNLRRLGYSEQDLLGQGSDRLIDDLVAYGEPEQLVTKLHAHLRAGADHVAVELLPEPGTELLDGYRRLASLLGLADVPDRLGFPAYGELTG